MDQESKITKKGYFEQMVICQTYREKGKDPKNHNCLLSWTKQKCVCGGRKGGGGHTIRAYQEKNLLQQKTA